MKKQVDNIVSVTRGYTGIKIYINDLLHLYLKNGITGIQSWREDGIYSIEYTYADTSVLSEYDKKQIWENILKQINKVI